MRFNEAQQEAVDFYQGPCLTLAGPGSGKTAVITHRTKNLIEKYGVSPSEILVVTFTKAAAMEMKERFLSLTNQTSTTATFGTFHAVFFTVLKYAYHYRAENIIRDEQKVVFIRNLLRHFPIDYEDENECIQTLLSEISGVKNSNIPIEHYYSSNFPEHTFRDVFMNYQKMLQKNRLIDFDDMLVYTYELFSQRKDILALWQKKFRYILIDEFQDINGLQYEIIRMLAAPENNLFVVGDDDQSIYRFRQARPEIMLNFEKDYADAKRIVLNYNYRSDGNIVAAAGRLIAHNTGRFAKDIKVSNTQTISPGALGHSDEERTDNLVGVLDGYFSQGAHHLNVNVFGTEKLIDAMEHPEKPEYANFTIRVSGYAVKFIDLTREQQMDVIARTCHDRM